MTGYNPRIAFLTFLTVTKVDCKKQVLIFNIFYCIQTVSNYIGHIFRTRERRKSKKVLCHYALLCTYSIIDISSRVHHHDIVIGTFFF